MKKNLKTLIKIIVSVGLIFYLVTKKIDKNQLISNFKLLDWRYLPLMIFTIIIHYIISSFRWKSLLIHENSHKISRWYLFKLYFVG
ncbi:MAG TPA: lysylphosphatidylglycerol synthase domain-containing protein, partial [bacterium]|nr:lysylphosphatidylglycerol synthase domain-containing protein [bacterium]